MTAMIGAKKWFKAGWIIFLILSLAANCIHAQVFEDRNFRDLADQGLAFTYNMEFDQADVVFNVLKDHYTSHPGPYYLLAFNRWWQSYVSTTTAFHGEIQQYLALALTYNAKLANRPETELEYTFFQYMIYAFQARLHVLRKEWWSGANSGLKALPYLESGFQFTQQSPEFFFSSGVYHYYAATYPEKNSAVRPFMVFFPEGDEALGLKELHAAAVHKNFTQTESLYYLGDIYLEAADYQEALAFKRKLWEKYPNNTWFQADYARALIYAGKYAAGMEILEEIRETFEEQEGFQSKQISILESPYTSYLMLRVYHYLGKAYLEYDRNPEWALEQFDLSLKMAAFCRLTENNYIPANHYYRGHAFRALGDEAKAKEAFSSALETPENEAIADQAQEALSSLD